jgi:hypothetical protein
MLVVFSRPYPSKEEKDNSIPMAYN